MKRAFVAVEDSDEITPQVKKELELLAKKKDVEIQGIVQYPRGMILENPEVFIETMKTVKADCALVSSPEFVIHEIQTNGKLAEMAKKDNLQIIDTTLEMDIADIKEAIPKRVMDELKALVNLKQSLNESLNEMMARTESKHCAMIITRDSESERIKNLTDDIAEQGYKNFSIVEMSDYISPMDKMYESVIQDRDVDKIVVADAYDSIEFQAFLKQQEDKGMEITYGVEEEQSMDMNSRMTGMLMN